MEPRESIVFYRSFFESIDSMPKELQADCYKAVIQYGLDGVIPEQGNMGYTMWLAFRKQIDTNQKRYENSLKAKGGRNKEKDVQGNTEEKPKLNQTQTKIEPNTNQNKTNLLPNVNVNENVNVNVNVNDNENVSVSDETDIPDSRPKKEKPVKHKYGEYNNVLLTDEEFNKLSQICNVYEMIDKLSGYIESKGVKYKSHYATIRNWLKKDKEQRKPEKNESRLDSFYQMAADWANESEGG